MIEFPPIEAVTLHPLPENDHDGRGLFAVGCWIPVYLVFRHIRVLLFWIPRGLITDGGSIPRAARPWFDPWGRFGMDYVLHDALFFLTDWPKLLIDLILLAGLLRRGCHPAAAAAKFLAACSRSRRPGDVGRFHDLNNETAPSPGLY